MVSITFCFGIKFQLLKNIFINFRACSSRTCYERGLGPKTFWYFFGRGVEGIFLRNTDLRFFFFVYTFAKKISERDGLLKYLTILQTCRLNLTPKIGPVYLIQNCLQSCKKTMFWYIESPKNQVLYLFDFYQLNKINYCLI